MMAGEEAGALLRLCRERLGMTQAELGVALGVGSLAPHRAVQDWERGINPVPMMALRAIRDLCTERKIQPPPELDAAIEASAAR